MKKETKKKKAVKKPKKTLKSLWLTFSTDDPINTFAELEKQIGENYYGMSSAVSATRDEAIREFEEEKDYNYILEVNIKEMLGERIKPRFDDLIKITLK